MAAAAQLLTSSIDAALAIRHPTIQIVWRRLLLVLRSVAACGAAVGAGNQLVHAWLLQQLCWQLRGQEGTYAGDAPEADPQGHPRYSSAAQNGSSNQDIRH